jgi:hypothetical protein
MCTPKQTLASMEADWSDLPSELVQLTRSFTRATARDIKNGEAKNIAKLFIT